MVRVTARQAFTRSKAKRQRQREEKVSNLMDAREKYMRQLAGMLNAQVVGDREPQQQSDDGSQAPVRHALAPNRKLTDFYPVYSRGRENIPKSPPAPKVRHPSLVRQRSTNLRPLRPGTPELIVIEDSDDEEQSLSHSLGSNEPIDNSSADSENVAPLNGRLGAEPNVAMIEQQGANQSIPASSDQQSFPNPPPVKGLQDVKPIVLNLNGTIPNLDLSVTVEEDVEITAYLPPISLRDHEVHLIADDDDDTGKT